MKNLLKKLLGTKRYYRTFHTSYGVGKKKNNLYHCPTCNITQYRTPYNLWDKGPY